MKHRSLPVIANHIASEQLGGDSIRIIGDPPDGWLPRAGLPGPTRASCPPERHATGGCQFVRCRFNLLYRAPVDSPGRRHYDRLPPEAVVWRKGPSCMLDITDAHPSGMTSTELGDALGMTKRNVELLLLRALGKAAPDLAALFAKEESDVTTAPRMTQATNEISKGAEPVSTRSKEPDPPRDVILSLSADGKHRSVRMTRKRWLAFLDACGASGNQALLRVRDAMVNAPAYRKP